MNTNKMPDYQKEGYAVLLAAKWLENNRPHLIPYLKDADAIPTISKDGSLDVVVSVNGPKGHTKGSMQYQCFSFDVNLETGETVLSQER